MQVRHINICMNRYNKSAILNQGMHSQYRDLPSGGQDGGPGGQHGGTGGQDGDPRMLTQRFLIFKQRHAVSMTTLVRLYLI